jgi:hypothetical protein
MYWTLILSTMAFIAQTISGLAMQTNVANGNVAIRAPEPTAAPAGPHLLQRNRKVVRRDPAATCGYIDGDKDEAIGCEDGFACNFWPDIPLFSSAPGIGAVGAVNCAPAGSSSVVVSNWYPATTCLDYKNGKYNTDEDSAVLSQTLYW